MLFSDIQATTHLCRSGSRATVFGLEVRVRFPLLLCVSLVTLSLAFFSRSSAGARETGFLDRSLSLHGTAYRYEVVVPDDWSPKQKWPIILFLHGKTHPEMEKDAYPDEPASYAKVARKIGKTPVWIFHGARDDTAPVGFSRKMNEALKAAGGDVHQTEYPGVGHNSRDKAYAEADLMPWLLSKSLQVFVATAFCLP
jgi:acetyl esterase/lipase